jgi:hypothetical protein
MLVQLEEPPQTLERAVPPSVALVSETSQSMKVVEVAIGMRRSFPDVMVGVKKSVMVSVEIGVAESPKANPWLAAAARVGAAVKYQQGLRPASTLVPPVEASIACARVGILDARR